MLGYKIWLRPRYDFQCSLTRFGTSFLWILYFEKIGNRSWAIPPHMSFTGFLLVAMMLCGWLSFWRWRWRWRKLAATKQCHQIAKYQVCNVDTNVALNEGLRSSKGTWRSSLILVRSLILVHRNIIICDTESKIMIMSSELSLLLSPSGRWWRGGGALNQKVKESLLRSRRSVVSSNISLV